MRKTPKVGGMTVILLPLLGLSSVGGCSSPPTEPDSRQEWLTLEQYNVRAAAVPFPLNPVISVPEGSEVELRVSKKPA